MEVIIRPNADAAAAGCDVAVVTTQPGSRSCQNVQRQGFGTGIQPGEADDD